MEDFRDNKEFEEFCKVFDDSDQELYENVRFKLGTDFHKTREHNDIYNYKNFKNLTLDALEATRRKMSCKSCEEIIDILFILGYSTKRIIYNVWKLGYVGISFRDLRQHIFQNKRRLEDARDKYMESLKEKKIVLFQQMQEEVLSTEQRTLKLYLDNIKKAQDELENTSFVDEPAKWGRFRKIIDSLQEKVDQMHGITKKRDSSIRINEQLTLQSELKKLETLPANGALQVPTLEHDERLLDS